MIRVTDLVKIYPNGSVRAVDGVSFEVEEGAFYTLLGPSGCGKTTTLRCIAGLERADGGSIDLGDVTVVSDKVFVPTYRRDLGMVFQSYAVWPHMTVFENVAFPLRVGGERVKRETLRDRVEKALTLVGLEQYTTRMATQLSGGQQQRLSLARAIVREPKVLLLDEPLSNLDAKLRERMRGELSVIQRRLGVTTLFVTHDQVEALSMSDRIAVMDSGRIAQEGSPQEIYGNPVNEFVASFIGSTNLFLGTIDGPSATDPGRVRITTEFGSLEADANPAIDIGSKVIVAIRPEDVVLHRDGGVAPTMPNRFEAKVGIGLFTGNSVEYYVDVDRTLIQARSPSRHPLKRGDAVHIEFPVDALKTFVLDGEPKVRIGSRRLATLARVDDDGDG
ncbi:MAG TPA: ABC transporter ATP-binding protein [Candidatus Saccharimonadales bacterium]|nr:ABC transporter ATP-binding protein [Candidatus Saccharimonadales bacterium]